MAGPDIFRASHQITSIAAGTADQLNFSLPAGTWRLVAAKLLPSTTSAAHATNYTTIDIRNGATNLAVTALTTASVALTKGTERAFTITALYAEFVGGTNYYSINKTDAAAGAVMDCTFYLEFVKIHA